MANNEVKLDAPIPGQSLTAEPKSRPWRRPYELSTVDDAVAFYIPMFQDDTFNTLLLEQIENGVPLTSITEILITSNTMEGKHSIDVGILTAPVLIEAMQTLAEADGIDYVIGTETEAYRKDYSGSEVVRRAVKESAGDKGDDLMLAEAEMEEPQEMDQEVMPERTGLMARRSAE